MLINPACPTSYFHKKISFKRWNIYFITVFACLGFMLSVTQIFGISPDYEQYDDFLKLVRIEGLNVLAVSRFEPGFSIFSLALTTLFAANVVVYSSTVAVAMLLKGWAIKASASSDRVFYIVAAFYFVRYLPLHELTQLRVACAIALILVGAIFLWEGDLRRGLLFCAIATLFQMSAAAIIPMLFITTSKRSKVILIAFGMFLLTSIYASLVTGYLSSYIKILDLYQTHGFSDVKPNPFAINLLIDWAVIIVALLGWNRLTLLMKRIVLLELIGMAIFYGAMDFGVIAHRLRDFYSVFWVFFIADGLRLKATKALSYGFILVSMVLYSYLFFISGKFFH